MGRTTNFIFLALATVALIAAYQNFLPLDRQPMSSNEDSALPPFFMSMEGESKFGGPCTGAFDPRDPEGQLCRIEQAELGVAVPFMVFPFTKYRAERSNSDEGIDGGYALRLTAVPNTAMPDDQYDGDPKDENLRTWKARFKELLKDPKHKKWQTENFRSTCRKSRRQEIKDCVAKGKSPEDCASNLGNECKLKDKFQLNISSPCEIANPDNVKGLKGMYTFRQGETRFLGFSIFLDENYEVPAGQFFLHMQMLHVNASYCGGPRVSGVDSGHPPLTLSVDTIPENRMGIGTVPVPGTKRRENLRRKAPIYFNLEGQHMGADGHLVPQTRLFRQELKRGQWYRFLFRLTPNPSLKVRNGSYEGGGNIALWVNEKKVLAYNGPWSYPADDVEISKGFILGLGYYRQRQLAEQKFFLDDVEFSTVARDVKTRIPPRLREKMVRQVSSWGHWDCEYKNLQMIRRQAEDRVIPAVDCRTREGHSLSLLPPAAMNKKIRFAVVRAKMNGDVPRLNDIPTCARENGRLPCRVVCGKVLKDEKNPHVCHDEYAKNPVRHDKYRYVLFRDDDN